MGKIDIDPTSGATVREVRFKKSDVQLQHASGVRRDSYPGGDDRPRDASGKLLTAKQIRARARRRMGKKKAPTKGVVTTQEFDIMYKPVSEWDLEELSQGRPRNAEGNFRGRKPAWVSREVHEQAMEEFQRVIKQEMASHTPDAIKTIHWIITNEDEDARGKPMVPAAAKLSAAQFLIEHAVGKPKQHVQQDISVKLQGILGAAMVNPTDMMTEDMPMPGYGLGHFPGKTLQIGLPGDRDEEDYAEDEGGEG